MLYDLVRLCFIYLNLNSRIRPTKIHYFEAEIKFNFTQKDQTKKFFKSVLWFVCICKSVLWFECTKRDRCNFPAQATV